MSFAGKTWAQIAGGATSRVFSSSSSDTDLHPERSLEILADQVSGILKKLSFVKLVLLASLSGSVPLVVSVLAVSVVNLDMALDDEPTVSVPSFSGATKFTAVLSLSGSRVFISKMGGLESKILVWKFATCNVQDINVLAKQADIVHWHVSSGNMVSFITKMKLRTSSGP
ncbi:hypothetical protein G9A89_021575 [Geosiphon pyriformis]|nr:hypothetical protein G9A89_021575 [Geosiphon pyriformis]